MAKEAKNNDIVITPDNIANVVLKGIKKTYNLSTSFDDDARKAGKTAEVEVIVTYDNVDLDQVIEKANGKYAIKVNQPGFSKMKGAVATADQYLDHLEKMGHKIEVSALQLGARTRRGGSPVASGISAWDRMTPEERKNYAEWVKQQEAAEQAEE